MRALPVPRPLLAALCAVALCALASCSITTPMSGGAGAPAPPAATGPGPAALQGWKLTVPEVGKNGNAKIIEPAAVTDPWLTTDGGGNLVFWAPVSGATTKHSSHARTELDNLNNFTAGAERQALAATVSVAQVPTADPSVILGQIHGADDLSSVPFVMLSYTDGNVGVVVKQQRSGSSKQDYPLLNDVPTGAPFDFGITDDGNGTLTFTAGYGDQHPSVDAPLPAAFHGATVRFQAGAYQQGDSAGGGAGPQDGARVTFSALRAGAPTP